MALRPGDSVSDSSCERVGNFPHGLLANPNALALSSGAFGSTPTLSSRKQAYIDAFDANDLTVCNENQFANLRSPYIVNLIRKGDEPNPEDPQEGQDFFVAIRYGVGTYSINTVGSVLFTSDLWFRQFKQSSIGEFHEDWSIGNVTFDLENGPGLIQKYYQAGLFGSYYINGTLFCEAVINYHVIGINGPWEDMILEASLELTFSNDYGTLVGVDTKTSERGFPSLSLNINPLQDTSLWPLPSGPGYLTKTSAFNIKVEILSKYPGYSDQNPF
jgi:hypothetical protein